MTDPTQPIRIDPDALYDDAALVLGLGFTSATLARERRAGRLQFTKRGKRIFYRGQWVLDWLTVSSTQPRIGAVQGRPMQPDPNTATSIATPLPADRGQP